MVYPYNGVVCNFRKIGGNLCTLIYVKLSQFNFSVKKKEGREEQYVEYKSEGKFKIQNIVSEEENPRDQEARGGFYTF